MLFVSTFKPHRFKLQIVSAVADNNVFSNMDSCLWNMLNFL